MNFIKDTLKILLILLISGIAFMLCIKGFVWVTGLIWEMIQ